MIRLLEHEGKALLARHGIAIPPGALFPALPAAGPFMVKAQVFQGGRGKAGGIRPAEDAAGARQAAAAIGALAIGGERVRAVYVEQRLAVARELYLALQLDRDLGQVVILACEEGGVEIEAIPHERIRRFPVDPLIGLQGHTIAAVARVLGGGGTADAAIADILRRAYNALIAEDAELIEINPLVITADGVVIAADAKVLLDEDAAFRHPGRKSIPDGTAFEEAARALGVIGIEFEGDIAAMMNGAGMTMATLDQVIARGGSIRALVELHGAMARGPAHLAEIVGLMLTLRPRVLLFNAYFQFRNLETVAEGIAIALRAVRDAPPAVVRLRGVNAEGARRILHPLGLFVTEDFDMACLRAIALARGDA
jgi:succinyl-CoA synthetase beta subunit